MCAGVNRTILLKCPTDWAKYAGTGGTILFTALMAMLSGGYALGTVFDYSWTVILCGHTVHIPYLAIGFGVFWGLLIFNLDRFIVNTMYSDGEVTISRREFFCGLPRIVMAIFLGLVISTPLEMRIFNDRIEYELDKMQDEARLESQKRNEQLYVLIKEKEDAIKEWREKQDKNEGELSDLEDKLYRETNGKGVTNTVGYGPAAKQLESQVKRKKAATEKANADIDRTINSIEGELESLRGELGQSKNNAEQAANALHGFTARYEALHRVSSWKNSKPLCMARIFIMLLFVIVEITPTVFKMMVAFGPYDDMLHAEMHKVHVDCEKQKSDINDEINTVVQISTQKNEQRLKAELAANEQILERISSVQAELLNVAIEEWRKEELAKIKADPSKYIKSNTRKG